MKLFDDLQWEIYKAAPRMNPSTLKVGCLQSMKHMRYLIDHGRPDKPAFVLGRACHCAVFESAELDNRYVIYDGRRDIRTKVYAELVEQCEADGTEILKTGELDKAVNMGLSVATDPIVQPYIQAGKAEITLFVEEGETQCKGRLDWVCRDVGFVDLKTSKNISAHSFGRDFFAYGYDISLGLYQRWLSRIRNQPEPCTVFAVEKEPPYDVAVITIPQAVLDAGAQKGLRVLDRYRECMDSGVWPGIANGEEFTLQVPGWVMSEEDDIDWS